MMPYLNYPELFPEARIGLNKNSDPNPHLFTSRDKISLRASSITKEGAEKKNKVRHLESVLIGQYIWPTLPIPPINIDLSTAPYRLFSPLAYLNHPSIHTHPYSYPRLFLHPPSPTPFPQKIVIITSRLLSYSPTTTEIGDL
jgi:hypothetical protein